MIIVFGSINIDFVTPVTRLPGRGETVAGPGYTLHPGGKGANQALAAARAGASVAMVGAVGRDGLAEPALALLRTGGVDLGQVARVDAPTGAAFIAVEDGGENQIVVASGANAHVRASQLAGLPLSPGDSLLLQREVPLEECIAAARLAKQAGARVILNLAPAGGDPHGKLLAETDIVVMNETEALLHGAHAGLEGQGGADRVATALRRDGVPTIVVTLGAGGAVAWHSAGDRAFAAAHAVNVVDTTGAGDAFCGAFAAALDEGRDIHEAMRFGVAAGSLACMQAGAQPSLPFAADIVALVSSVAGG